MNNGTSFQKAIRFFTLGTASVGFIGYIPYRLIPFSKWKGSGFLGTLAGWSLLWLIPAQGTLFWTLLFGVLFLSVWVSHYAEKWLTYDDPRIVIDELIGVWVSAALLPRTLWPMLGAFILFRFFDVLKGPWGRWVARLPGGFGVVADDILAGILANVCVRILYWIHGYI